MAVLCKALADIRRRKLQTTVITIVVLLSSLAGTLALTLAVETDAPFDRAFAQEEGAHLMVRFDATQTTKAQLHRTASLPQVAVAGGPWLEAPLVVSTIQGQSGGPVVGRAGPGGPVDKVQLSAGRWPSKTGEVALSTDTANRLGVSIGGVIQPDADTGLPALKVVGTGSAVADSVAGWVVPDEIQPPASRASADQTATAPAGAVKGPAVPDYVMVYRLHQAATAADIDAAARAIAATVPKGSVIESQNYLNLRSSATTTTAVMIPFLLAFSAFALVASALIIGNVVSGAVIAGYREIGVMKAIGFTPGQVVGVLVAQMTAPALLGCFVGIPIGIVASQPFLSDVANAFNLPQTFAIAYGVDALCLAAVLLVVVLSAAVPALRAARMSSAQAIATAMAPVTTQGYIVGRLLARLLLPRSMTLGSADAVARPLRSLTTVGAIVFGVATVTFALGLSSSLELVKSSLERTQQVPVEVFAGGGAKGGPVVAAAGSTTDVATIIGADPGVAHFVGTTETDATVGSLGRPVPLWTYSGDASWTGYRLIDGRWFHGAGEAVAPTAFYTRTHTHVGDTISVTIRGKTEKLRLVGEIFDQQGDNVLLRADASVLVAAGVSSQPATYEISLRRGIDAVAWTQAWRQAHPDIQVDFRGGRGFDTAFVLINAVIFGLALILTGIAMAGVFNTVVLGTREKARDTAILKALGMTPRQVVAMVLTSIGVLAVIGAMLGIPAGRALHQVILTQMGQIASGTRIPAALFDVYSLPLLAGLAAFGVAVALLAALLPATWAAATRVSEMLAAE